MTERIMIIVMIFGLTGSVAAQPAARLGDPTVHGGLITAGCSTVLIEGKPSARMGDMHLCPMVIPPGIPHTGGVILKGEPTVLIGGQPAARVGDPAYCVGETDIIGGGASTVLIGTSPASATDVTQKEMSLPRSLEPKQVKPPQIISRSDQQVQKRQQIAVSSANKTIATKGKIVIQSTEEHIEFIAGKSKIVLYPSGRILIEGESIEINADTNLKLNAVNIEITC